MLGCYCHKLVKLHLNQCSDVTDKGIRNLILDPSGTVQCPDISKLHMEATGTTSDAVQVNAHLLLLNCSFRFQCCC